MLFRRRIPETPWQRVRVALWPRRSFRRSFRYVVKRILRIDATPHAIALGVAAGVFSAFNPFLGLHTLLAVAIAWALSGNMITAAISTWFGNPATYPLIWAGTWELGSLLVGLPAEHGPVRHADFGLSIWRIAEVWDPVLKPMLVGSLPLGVLAAAIAYPLAKRASIAFAARREERLDLYRPKETGA